MKFQIRVGVEVEHVEGKFASREEIFEQLRDEIQSADPGTVECDGGGCYDVVTFEVEEPECP